MQSCLKGFMLIPWLGYNQQCSVKCSTYIFDIIISFPFCSSFDYRVEEAKKGRAGGHEASLIDKKK